MATTEMPPPLTTPPARKPPENVEEFHLLLEELQDERDRSRLREAFWISIIIHFVLAFAIALSPKYLPKRAMIIATPAQQAERDSTFLELPPDVQKLTQRPKTNIISDKDRIASSRTPQPDRKLLEQLRDSRVSRPAAPQPQRPAPQPPQGAQQPSPQVAQQAAPQQPEPQSQQQPTQTAKLEAPKPARNPFGTPLSARSAIDQAARATAGSRGGGGVGTDVGQPIPGGGVQSNIDVLSDTMGVDFGPYLSRVLVAVRRNWYNIIPEVARPPIMKKGKVSIEFAIGKSGQVEGMRLAGESGDIALDRAAWGGITGSNPFPPLPAEFRGQNLALRFHFYYNPDKGELR